MQLIVCLRRFNSGLRNVREKVTSVLTGGEFTVGLVAFTTHIFIQIASVLSRHMAVAFGIPAHTTGIYFTKLFSLRGMITLFASVFTYVLKLWISEDNIVLTLLFWFLVLLSRFVFLVYLFVSEGLAFDIYVIFVLDAIAVGLFRMTFYSLTAEYVSILGICFKASKIWVFLFQMAMDLVFYDNPKFMVKVQYSMAFLLTCVSTGLWYNHIITKYNKSKTKTKEETESESNKRTELNKIETKIEEESQNSVELEKLKSEEPTFLQHFANAFSPLMMCLVPLMMKNILYPGLIPYALLERDNCHLINMVVTPVGLLGSILVHVLKKEVESINRRWNKLWNLLWLLGLPCFCVFVLTLTALHSKGRIAVTILDSPRVVFWMTVVFVFFHTMLEGVGYVGVVSNVKHCGKVMERGMKMVSTNQLMGGITTFLTYKVAVGYNVTRKKYYKYMEEDNPTRGMGWLCTLWYWFMESCKEGFHDFLSDFKMDITKYL